MQMKKIFALTAISALLFGGCTDITDDPSDVAAYEGNQVVVYAPEGTAIAAEGGTYAVKVVTAIPLEVSIPRVASWLSSSIDENAGTEMVSFKEGEEVVEKEVPYSIVTFTATANDNLARYASVAILDARNHFSLYRLDVHQDGAIVDVPKKVFKVAPTEISVEADVTSATVEVTSEVAWTAVSDNPAITLAPSSGDGNATVTLSFPANTVDSKVTATITFSTTSSEVNAKSHEVSFEQAAKKQDKPAAVPAPGVLAEWHFKGDYKTTLNLHFNEAVADESADVSGNGGLYVEPNISGKGRLECYNGIADKSTVADKAHKRCKRTIGDYGEPVWYGTWKGDYILWTAEADAPLAATTKLRLFFTVRPNNAQVMKYWLVEYLDGETWKPAGETTAKDDFTYNLELYHGKDHINATIDPSYEYEQINTRIDRTVTLSSDTPKAQFRISCVATIGANGSPVTQLAGSYVLRFAGETTNANTPYYAETEHPRIEVVE